MEKEYQKTIGILISQKDILINKLNNNNNENNNDKVLEILNKITEIDKLIKTYDENNEQSKYLYENFNIIYKFI